MSSPFIIIDEIEDKINEINSGLSSTLSTINTNVNTIVTKVGNIETYTKGNNTASTTGTLSQKISSAIANSATKTGIISQKASYAISLLEGQNSAHGTQIYSTAGAYSWTPPTGVGYIYVIIIGGSGMAME